MRILRTVLVATSCCDERGVLDVRVCINQDCSLGALAGLIEDDHRRHAGEAEVHDARVDEPLRGAALDEEVQQHDFGETGS